MDRDSETPKKSSPNNGWATKADVDRLIHSKEHFVALFAVKGGFLLPPIQFLTWSFIRQILKGEKKLIRISEISAIYVPPKVSELTVANLMAQIRHEPRIMTYLPDGNRPIDRKFFFAVMATILPNFYGVVLEKIKQNRHKEIAETQKVEICPEMTRLIQENIPYFGKEKKVGQFLNNGRRWGTHVQRQHPQLDITQLF